MLKHKHGTISSVVKITSQFVTIFFFRKPTLLCMKHSRYILKLSSCFQQLFLFLVCKSEYLQNSLYFPTGSANVNVALFNYVKQQESFSSLFLDIHNSISQYSG